MNRASGGKRSFDRDAPELRHYSWLANLLDQAFRIPGTRFRFGLDAIIGLVPGAGDFITALAGTYGLWLARELGAPASVQGRMLLNLAVDALVGAVPLLGDLFDFAFKAHVRNHELLGKWLESPRPTRKSSRLVLAGAILVLLFICVSVIWVTIAILRWLFSAIG